MKNMFINTKNIVFVVYTLIFLLNIYYQISFFISASDFNLAYVSNDYTLIYLNHPDLLVSRIVASMLNSQSLNFGILDAFMIVILLIAALDIIDIIYIGLLLVSIYLCHEFKGKFVKMFSVSSISQVLLLIIFVLISGLLVLSVYMIGTTSIEQILSISCMGISIFTSVLVLINITSYLFYLINFFKTQGNQ